MPLDATWNITVQWLAGDTACRTLMFLKLEAMYAAAFLPVVIGLDRQAAILHPFGPRSAVRKLLGVAWGLSLLLALPQVSDLGLRARLNKNLSTHEGCAWPWSTLILRVGWEPLLFFKLRSLHINLYFYCLFYCTFLPSLCIILVPPSSDYCRKASEHGVSSMGRY